MKDTPNEKDLKTSPQLTEIFLKSEYVFHIDSTNKNFDIIIATALTNTKAYELYFNKLRLRNMTPKQHDLHCLHEIML